MFRNDPTGPATSRTALIVGGGLAGISAAMELADHGWRVTLLEKRPYLGGRTFSFVNKETGTEVDNGQHIFLKCCVAYRALLKKLGVLDKTTVQRRMRVEVMNGNRRTSALYSSPLPAPLHLLPSFVCYRHLSWRDKLAIVWASLSMRRMSNEDRLKLDDLSFADWLKERGQSDSAIAGFWDLIIIPTLNDPAKWVSAAQAIMVFQEGFLNNAHGADVGVATVGLSGIIAGVTPYIESRGGAVVLGKSLARLEGGLEAVNSARLYSQPPMRVGAYVLAVPPRLVGKLLPESLRRHEFFERVSRLAMSPIVNLHLWFDRRVADIQGFIALIDNQAQWVFDKPEEDGSMGQRLAVSLSAAHKYIDMTKEELVPLIVGELARAFPVVKEAVLTRSIVVRERYATFSPRPGSARYRVSSWTPVPNLFLAGEWTDTDWPSTMESAVRSGLNAAQEVMKAT